MSQARDPLGDAYDDGALLRDVASRSARYLTSIAERDVAPSAAALAGLPSLDAPLPERGADPARVLAEFDDTVSGATMAVAGPRFFGYVNGSTVPAALAVNWLATAWDVHGGFQVLSPGTTRMEQIAGRWLLRLLDLPREATCAFVTGTTTAHIATVATARSALLRSAGWDCDDDGLRGAPAITVVVSEEAHASLFKALSIVGMGRRQVVRVPVDAQGRLRADAIPRLETPTLLCLQAGNVNTGSTDPCRDAISAVREQGVASWVHVDGAFGLWARVSPALAGPLDGVDGADSWALDGHKWLNVPYDCGVAIVRDGEAMRRALSTGAAYLPVGPEHRNLSDHTLEMARRPRGVDVWAAIRSLGRDGIVDLVERCCGHARRMAGALVAAGHEVLNEVVLNQVLVSFGAPERTQRIIAAVQRDGTCWCGGTVWQGRTAMRISIVSWTTTDADIEMAIAAILRIAQGER